jgi:Fe-S-cluster containining protein
MDCKGLCSDRCGAIPCSSLERTQIEARSGKPFGTDGTLTCSMLKGTRCTAYTLRPLICRVWGTTKEMACPHGCEPERWLSKEEFSSLAKQINELSNETGDQVFARMFARMQPNDKALWSLQVERREREAA